MDVGDLEKERLCLCECGSALPSKAVVRTLEIALGAHLPMDTVLLWSLGYAFAACKRRHEAMPLQPVLPRLFVVKGGPS